ncbi:MAG: hemerythrin family protein [Planctomycetaceae bacterium]|nr:hemerythrin family protein [Planctomycetaceae bacterium]
MLWSPVFQCQIPHIDAQHKALFEHIEKLGTMHGNIARIPETLEFLETYTNEHFSDEQSLHQQTRYPRALEHQRQHQGFARHIGKMRTDYTASGHNLSTLMEMNHAIVEWLNSHILSSDKQFAEFYHALPGEKKRSLRLPHRPWIPESSQSFYQEATGIRTKKEPSPAIKSVTRVTASSWSDAMLCGIPLIDEQHRELFRQIDILRDRGNKDRIPNVLRFLADYVVKHFNDEESIHLRSRYPQASEHRKLHVNFIQTFQELKAKFDKSNGDLSAILELNKVVFEWLREHVMKVDKQFATYYLALEENREG